MSAYLDSPIPRPILTVHAEDVDLEIPGLLNIRATFLSEGLFDERSGGDPDEEDLYEVEVTHQGEALLQALTFPRLAASPPKEWADATDAELASLPMERFVLALGWELANADPSNWPRICDAARTWDAWTLEDALLRIPSEWTPETLLPDLD